MLHLREHDEVRSHKKRGRIDQRHIGAERHIAKREEPERHGQHPKPRSDHVLPEMLRPHGPVLGRRKKHHEHHAENRPVEHQFE